MRTDKGGGTSLSSTAIETAASYRLAAPDPRKGQSPSTTLTVEHARSVMTRRTEGTVEVRIGLAEFPRPQRPTSV